MDRRRNIPPDSTGRAFDIETGIPSHPRTVANYTDVFSTVMCKLGQRDERVVAITAAMPDGTGKAFPEYVPGPVL